jgi:hypothetical protein
MNKPPTNENHVSDRRGASPKRSSDVAASEWKIITRSAYNEMLAGRATDLNLQMKRLAMGKIRLGHALLAVDGALMDHNPQTRGEAHRLVYNRLRSVRKKLEDAFAQYPLEVR